MGHIAPLIVELAADATWPAETTIPLGPWLLRANHGYTNRANSVRTASTAVDADWQDLITQAEDFYRPKNLPTIFHLSAATFLPNLDDLLTKRGYSIEKSSQVWWGDPHQIRDASNRRETIGKMVLSADLDERWLHCPGDESKSSIERLANLCSRIPAPRAFAQIIESDRSVSRALAVVHSNIAFLYCMATPVQHQRRGLATQLIHQLSVWAIANAADAFYLQVMADNAPARALYARASFRHQYDYHYRVKR